MEDDSDDDSPRTKRQTIENERFGGLDERTHDDEQDHLNTDTGYRGKKVNEAFEYIKDKDSSPGSVSKRDLAKKDRYYAASLFVRGDPEEDKFNFDEPKAKNSSFVDPEREKLGKMAIDQLQYEQEKGGIRSNTIMDRSSMYKQINDQVDPRQSFKEQAQAITLR